MGTWQEKIDLSKIDNGMRRMILEYLILTKNISHKDLGISKSTFHRIVHGKIGISDAVFRRMLDHLSEEEFMKLLGSKSLEALGLIRDGVVDYGIVIEILDLALRDRYLRSLIVRWASEHFEDLKQELVESIRMEYEAKYRQWIQEHEKKIREDAIKRSIGVILGRVGEHIAPFLVAMDLGIDPRDLRYLGSPVDYIAFKGLSNGEPEEIIFIEIKSMKSKLNEKERMVKRLVEEKRVRWVTYSLSEIMNRIKKEVNRYLRSLLTT